MKQNLAWASVYNVLAIPVAAGVFYSLARLVAAPRDLGAADVGLVHHRGAQRRVAPAGEDLSARGLRSAQGWREPRQTQKEGANPLSFDSGRTPTGAMAV